LTGQKWILAVLILTALPRIGQTQTNQIEGFSAFKCENHPGSTWLETAAAKAERLITQEPVRLNWQREDPLRRPKS